MFYNVRDKSGRFVKKDTIVVVKKARKPKIVKQKVNPIILNVFVLDDSVSMQSKRDATIEGFNSVLNDARSVIDNITSYEYLCKFGLRGNFYKYSGVVDKLTHGNYNPNQGATALWDAIIEGLKYTAQLAGKYNNGNLKIIFTIFTDGQENSSAVGAQYEAQQLIKKYQDMGWVINFIGAGEKKQVETVADSVGIFMSNTMNYSDDIAGTTKAFNKFSVSNTSYRSTVSTGEDSNIGFFTQD